MNNELYHWKYVKREKVGDKWKYYYDTGSLKKDAKNFVKDPVGTKAKAEYRNAYQKYLDTNGRGAARAMRDPYYADERRKAENLAKRGIKYVPTELKTPFAEDKNVGHKVVADLKREEHAKIEMDRAKKKYENSLVGKLDKSASNTRHLINEAKHVVKDKLGYDERDRFNDSLQEVNRKASYDQRTAGKAVRTTEDTANILGMGTEYIKARNDFLKTPLGFVTDPSDSVKAHIHSAREYVSDILEGRKVDWEAAEKRGTDKAIKEATKYDGGIEISANGSKKIGKTTFTDVDDWLSGTTTIDTGDTRVSQVRRGKLERYADTAKEYAADRKKRKK